MAARKMNATLETDHGSSSAHEHLCPDDSEPSESWLRIVVLLIALRILVYEFVDFPQVRRLGVGDGQHLLIPISAVLGLTRHARHA